MVKSYAACPPKLVVTVTEVGSGTEVGTGAGAVVVVGAGRVVVVVGPGRRAAFAPVAETPATQTKHVVKMTEARVIRAVFTDIPFDPSGRSVSGTTVRADRFPNTSFALKDVTVFFPTPQVPPRSTTERV